jgi:tripartite-type tricarboxylate transporter receptor subunit TctC
MFRQFFALGLLAFAGASATAQADWPTKPIRLIQPFSAGGPGDVTARMFSEDLSRDLKQTVITENKPGAGGVIGASYVARSAPDGYTFLLAGNGAITNFLLRKDMLYAESDLAPVALTHSAPSIMVVNPALGVRNLADLQAYAQKHGGITFADAGAGSTGHFVAEMVRMNLKIPVTPIHYKSGSESVMAVIGGQVTAASEAGIGVLPNIRAGKLVAITVSADKRLPLLPNVATSAEQGFPGIQMEHWTGYFAPRDTPAAILDRMNAALARAAQDPNLRKELESTGYRVLSGNRAQFQAFMNKEKKRLGDVVRETGMTSE